MQSNIKAMPFNSLGSHESSGNSEVKHPVYSTAKMVGICPECGDSVFELTQTLSCFNALKGNCSFVLELSQLGQHAMPNDYIQDLLEGALNYEVCSADMAVEYSAHLVRLENRGWCVEFFSNINTKSQRCEESHR